jgi:hypothetical protein
MLIQIQMQIQIIMQIIIFLISLEEEAQLTQMLFKIKIQIIISKDLTLV